VENTFLAWDCFAIGYRNLRDAWRSSSERKDICRSRTNYVGNSKKNHQGGYTNIQKNVNLNCISAGKKVYAVTSCKEPSISSNRIAG
jgi:hypothetical protein